jgi:hypothetical protein
MKKMNNSKRPELREKGTKKTKTSGKLSFSKIIVLWDYAEDCLKKFPNNIDFYLFLTYYLINESKQLSLNKEENDEIIKKSNRFQGISSQNDWTEEYGQFGNVTSFIDNDINNNSNPSAQTIDIWKGLIKMVKFYSRKETPLIEKWKKSIDNKVFNKPMENSIVLGSEIDKMCKQQGEDLQTQKKMTLNLIEALKKAITKDQIPESKQKIKEVLSSLKNLNQIIGKN